MTFPPTLNLNEIDGQNGFVINGVAEGDRSGFSVSEAGDVNGDGINDLIIGTARQSFFGAPSSESYVVFGGQDFSDGSFNLAELNGSNGFVINRSGTGGPSATNVSNAGDVNGDGFDDVIVGEYGIGASFSSQAGVSYVIFGQPSFSSSQVNVAELDGADGFVINSIDDFFSRSVSGAGDVNGDGLDDLLIGASGADPDGLEDAGASYVVFGSQNFSSGGVEVSELDGTNGFVINGINADDRLGNSVSHAGDLNGDGSDDIVLGTYGADPGGLEDAGASYVIFGGQDFSSGSFDLAELDSTNGFVVEGLAGEVLGVSVSDAGDFNDDGFDDIAIVASSPDDSREQRLELDNHYLVFGRSDFEDARLSVADLNGSNGLAILGSATSPVYSDTVVGANDINGDGFDDVVISLYYDGLNGNPGNGYVIFGEPHSDSLINLAELDGSNGFFFGTRSSAGQGVDGAGDINGDGIDDFIVGNLDTSPDGIRGAGSSFVVFGRSSVLPDAFTVVDGDNGDRLLFPEGSGEVIVGDFDIDEGFFGSPELTFDTLELLDGAFQGSYSSTQDFLDLTFAIENDFDGSTDALRDGDDLIFSFGNGDSIRFEDAFGRDGLTVERFEANGGDIFTPDAIL